jgi:hypothetical protein
LSYSVLEAVLGVTHLALSMIEIGISPVVIVYGPLFKALIKVPVGQSPHAGVVSKVFDQSTIPAVLSFISEVHGPIPPFPFSKQVKLKHYDLLNPYSN